MSPSTQQLPIHHPLTHLSITNPRDTQSTYVTELIYPSAFLFAHQHHQHHRSNTHKHTYTDARITTFTIEHDTTTPSRVY